VKRALNRAHSFRWLLSVQGLHRGVQSEVSQLRLQHAACTCASGNIRILQVCFEMSPTFTPRTAFLPADSGDTRFILTYLIDFAYVKSLSLVSRMSSFPAEKRGTLQHSFQGNFVHQLLSCY